MIFKKKFNKIVIILLVTINIQSCKYEIRKNYEKIQVDGGKIPKYVYYFKTLNIFDKPLKKIGKEIKSELIKNPIELDKFKSKFISIDLYCDTNDCKIQSLELTIDKGYPELSKKVINYLNQFKNVDCFDKNYKQKISHYTVSIHYNGKDISVSIGYGYRIRHATPKTSLK